MSFDELKINDNILRGVYAHGFEKPSSIQLKSIPIILSGKDIVAQAQSGTGKTGAFSIGSLISLGELISSFSLAWIIGLIVPAAPGGLGVFESVVLYALGSKLPEAPLLASLL